MQDWRTPVGYLRRQLINAKKAGLNQVDISALEHAINDIETDMAIRDKYEILNQTNKNWIEEFSTAYQKSLNNYAETLDKQSEIHKKYTQLIISAGYAAYFGVWSIAKDIIEKSNIHAIHLAKISAIFVLISITSFIILEVIRIGIDGYNVTVRADILFKAKLEDSMLISEQKSSEHQAYQAYANLLFKKFWSWSYPTSIIFGLSGIAFLIYALSI
jgi:hypothetical protein